MPASIALVCRRSPSLSLPLRSSGSGRGCPAGAVRCGHQCYKRGCRAGSVYKRYTISGADTASLLIIVVHAKCTMRLQYLGGEIINACSVHTATRCGIMCIYIHTGKLEGASLAVYCKPSNAESDAKILGKVLVDTKVCIYCNIWCVSPAPLKWPGPVPKCLPAVGRALIQCICLDSVDLSRPAPSGHFGKNS